MFEAQSTLMLVLSIALFAVKAFALVDCVARSEGTFVVAGTLPKRSWLIILALAVLTHVLWWSPLTLLNLAGTLAALVFLAQVRGSGH